MKKAIFAILSTLFQFTLFCNIGPQGFSSFPNDYFVETGTYLGNGIQRALQDNFNEVRSIEASIDHFLYAKQRFSQYPNVKITLGDSSKDLWMLIKDINRPITFWLDAHSIPTGQDGEKNCPLMEELEQIKQHPIKTHTILIDDLHCCNTVWFDFLTKKEIKKKIRSINKNYQFTYVDGGDDGSYKNNVLVAFIPAQ